MIFKGPDAPPLPTKDVLSFVFDTPPDNVNKPILIDADNPSRNLSFAQLKHMVQQCIAGFNALGVKPGDCVLMHALNDIHYIPLAQAIIGCGAIYAGSNPMYTPNELVHHIKVTSTTWVIAEPETLPTVVSAAKTTNIPHSHIMVFNPLPSQVCPPDFISYSSLLNHGTAPWVRFDSYEQAKSTTAGRYTSSGTSGLPKACINTHLNLIAQHEYNFSPQFYAPKYPVKILVPLPLFHASVSPRSLITIPKLNEQLYLMRRFDTEKYVQYIQQYQITDLVVVPPMAVAILNHAGVQAGQISLRSVKNGIIGAAPCTKETQARLVKLFAKDNFVNQIWGMTESNCLGMRFGWEENDLSEDGEVEGSVGRLCPGMEAKVVDVDTGEEIQPGPGGNVRGEICVRGEDVVPGYYLPGGKNQEMNRKDWDEDGFYHTGDIMYRDGKTGKWFVVDRVKELIKSRGFQVAPPELEGLLLTLDGVLDVAVIGVKDANDESELCRAYIVRKPGSEARLTEEVAKKWVSSQLVKYKWLDGGVKFVESIPKTPSGKILKRLLREDAERERRATSKL